jgi:hypothetical protein
MSPMDEGLAHAAFHHAIHGNSGREGEKGNRRTTWSLHNSSVGDGTGKAEANKDSRPGKRSAKVNGSFQATRRAPRDEDRTINGLGTTTLTTIASVFDHRCDDYRMEFGE